MDLKEEYDSIYEEVDSLFKEYNPCQFEGNSCFANRLYKYNSSASGGCCNGCQDLGPGGCKIKSLGCKLFICGCIFRSNSEFRLKITDLRNKAIGIHRAFDRRCITKEELFLRGGGIMR